MNTYIDAQCKNMIAMVRTFETACKIAATKDDGSTSKAEEKQLRKVRDAAQKFIKELEKI